MKKLLLSLLLIPFLLVGCKSSGKKSDTKTDQYINVVVNEVSIMEEDTYQIQTEIIKKGTIVFYSSADESIASVTDAGLITALSAGETTVTVRGGKDSFVIFVDTDLIPCTLFASIVDIVKQRAVCECIVFN